MRDKNILNVCVVIHNYLHKHTRSSSTYRTLNIIITMVLSMPVLIALILEKITTLGVKFKLRIILYSAQLATHTINIYMLSVYDK